jgi:prepilin signal peptidase PulO-like enzyme (type II secretory pathway)
MYEEKPRPDVSRGGVFRASNCLLSYNYHMEFLVAAAFFVFGSIIGSFLNVLILRFNTGATFGGRSKCFSCGRELRWYDLVPILSFLFLRGRCRFCKSKISLQYPTVELITGLIFTGVF